MTDALPFLPAFLWPFGHFDLWQIAAKPRVPSSMSIDSKLTELGITLPEAPKPVASYIPCVRTGNLLFIAGQIPFKNGALTAIGRVGISSGTDASERRVSIDAAQLAARQCAINALAVIKAEIGSLDRVVRIVKLGVFVACDPDFAGHPQVANGASDLLVNIFGDKGRHARAAVGAPSLPLNACVEVDMIVEVM
jgi:enamine deaminase RidA (YjgF/YER057c/UK114 family)